MPRPQPLPRSSSRDVEAVRRAHEDQGLDKPTHLREDGKRIEVSHAPSSTKILRHNLNRKLRGWYFVDGPKASAGLDGGVDETARSETTISLRNSSTRTLTYAIWVY